jgi:hypothetical protein
MKGAPTTDRIIGWISGVSFLVLFITVAVRVVPTAIYWLIAVLVVAPLGAAAVSILVERLLGTLRAARSRRRRHG